MKLKHITIHNIASIADAEIDFVASPLADTPLFLIAGPTGAGNYPRLRVSCSLRACSEADKIQNG